MDLPLHEGFGSSIRFYSESELVGLRDESELAAKDNSTGEEVAKLQLDKITDSPAESGGAPGEAPEPGNGVARGLVGESERSSSIDSNRDSSPSSTALS